MSLKNLSKKPVVVKQQRSDFTFKKIKVPPTPIRERTFEIAVMMRGTVKNLKVVNKKYKWSELCSLLSEVKEGKKDGPYFLRGSCSGKRSDENMGHLTLIPIDVDGGTTAPIIAHKKLEELHIRHCIYTSFSYTPDNPHYRIVIPTAGYRVEQLKGLVQDLIGQMDLPIKNVVENSTCSQAWYLPRCKDVTQFEFYRHDGKYFSVVSLPEQAPEVKSEPLMVPAPAPASKESHLKNFIESLKSGTVHAEAKKYAGWMKRTTNLSMKQIFDNVETLIEVNCSDPAKIERWHKSERTELQDWFTGQQFNEKSTVEIKEGTTVEEIMSQFIPTDDYLEGIGKEKWLYPNLVIQSHITVIIAMAGGGKTTFLFQELSPYVVREHGQKLFYVDADSPTTDHPKMSKFAAENGFTLILPNANQGTGVESFVNTLNAMNEAKMTAPDTVIIFDTMKKFIDLMKKSAVKEMFELCRGLQGLGATIIFAAHANKHRDSNGNMIPEGTGDVKNDTDTLIFFERGKTDEYGGVTITTVCDMGEGAKVRGAYESFSFYITEEREISMLDEPIEVVNYGSKRAKVADDTEILNAAFDVLEESDEKLTLSDLTSEVQEIVTAGVARVKKCISQNSREEGKSGPEQFTYTKGKNNAHLFG